MKDILGMLNRPAPSYYVVKDKLYVKLDVSAKLKRKLVNLKRNKF